MIEEGRHDQGYPKPCRLNGDQLLAVREAVAEVQRRIGYATLAERTIKGELDGQPLMQGAINAVERVLGGMFDG